MRSNKLETEHVVSGTFNCYDYKVVWIRCVRPERWSSTQMTNGGLYDTHVSQLVATPSHLTRISRLAPEAAKPLSLSRTYNICFSKNSLHSASSAACSLRIPFSHVLKNKMEKKSTSWTFDCFLIRWLLLIKLTNFWDFEGFVLHFWFWRNYCCDPDCRHS